MLMISIKLFYRSSNAINKRLFDANTLNEIIIKKNFNYQNYSKMKQQSLM